MGKKLTPDQVRQRLGYRNVQTIYRKIKSGELKAFNLGTATQPVWRIDQDDLADWLATRATNRAAR